MDTKESNNQNSRLGTWIIAGLACAAMLALGFNAYHAVGLREMREQIANMHTQVGQFRDGLAKVDRDYLNNLGTLKEEVDQVRKQAQTDAIGVGKAARAGLRKNAEMVSKIAKSGGERNQKLSEEINQIKEIAEQAATKISDVSSEVGEVKTEVATTKTEVVATRSELSQIIVDLRRTRGDLGVMSGLIATNSKELQALRELGEREYVEFRIPKNSQPQKIGDIQLVLKKSDPKRNRFTVEVVADDKRIQKKDKTTNEPVQFYVASKARQPYELVVNTVSKDSVSGYLAQPKSSLTASR